MTESITISPLMLVFLMCMTGFAGFVDSAAGGGGLISLPAYLFAGLPAHYTYGTNKFSAACGTTFATAQFFQKGAMNIKVACWQQQAALWAVPLAPTSCCCSVMRRCGP